MGKHTHQVIKIAEKMAKVAEQRLRKEMTALAKSGVLSRTEAKKLLAGAIREAEREEKRIRKFITSELKRELAKAKPAITKAVAKKRKQFESYRKTRKR
jgi:hypothetical protein